MRVNLPSPDLPCRLSVVDVLQFAFMRVHLRLHFLTVRRRWP
jgi:hypothetical protein